MEESAIRLVGPNVYNISGIFPRGDLYEKFIIPFATSQPPILFLAGTDDQLCPSDYMVSIDFTET